MAEKHDADLSRAMESYVGDRQPMDMRTIVERRTAQKKQRRRNRVKGGLAVAAIVPTVAAGAEVVKIVADKLDSRARVVRAEEAPIKEGVAQNKTEHAPGEATADKPALASPDTATGSVELDSPTTENQTVVITPEASSGKASSQPGGVAAENTPDTGGVSSAG